MQVTRHNLSLVLQDFKRDLAKCDFVAMDQEMCGIQRPGKEVLRSMTPVEAWVGPFFAARTYVAFQCGLCLCRIKRDSSGSANAAAAGGGAKNIINNNNDDPLTPTSSMPPSPSNNNNTSNSSAANQETAAAFSAPATSISLAGSTHKLELRPYNFWLRQHGRSAADVQLNMDAIDFLARNNMDFNMWLCDGMEYCGGLGAEAHRARLLPRAYPSNAPEAAVRFARFIKIIVVDQWYKGRTIDISLSLALTTAAAVAGGGGDDSGASNSSKQQQQSKKGNKQQQQHQTDEIANTDNTLNNTSTNNITTTLNNNGNNNSMSATRRILAGAACDSSVPSSPPNSPSAPRPSSTTATSAASTTFFPSGNAVEGASVVCEAQRVLLVAASPDGTLVAGGTSYGSVKVWNFLTLQHLATLKVVAAAGTTSGAGRGGGSGGGRGNNGNHNSNNTASASSSAGGATSSPSITSLMFHPNSLFVAAGTSHGTVAIWDISTARQAQSVAVTSAPIVAVRFDPRGLHLAIAARDGTVAVWDVVAAEFLVPPERKIPAQLVSAGKASITVFQYSSDCTRLLLGCAGDRRVRAYNSDTLAAEGGFDIPWNFEQKAHLTASAAASSSSSSSSSSISTMFFAVSPTGSYVAVPNVSSRTITRGSMNDDDDIDDDSSSAVSSAVSSRASSASRQSAAGKQNRNARRNVGNDGGSNSSSSQGGGFPILLLYGCGIAASSPAQLHESEATSAPVSPSNDEDTNSNGKKRTTAAHHHDADPSLDAESSPPSRSLYLHGHLSPVTSVEFSPHSSHHQLLSSSLGDGMLCVWDLGAGAGAATASSPTLLITLQHGPRTLPPAVASSMNSAMQVQAMLLGRSTLPNCICFTGRSECIATCGAYDGNVSVWELHHEDSSGSNNKVAAATSAASAKQNTSSSSGGAAGGSFTGGAIVSFSHDSVVVNLPDRCFADLPTMLLTDLLLAKCDVELERRHVGGSYVFRRRAPGFCDIFVRRRQEELTERLGFRLFFEAVKEAQKPLIGHHFTSDLAFFINQHETGIREDFAWFKRTAHSLFPSVYDTKSLAARLGATHINLEDLFNRRQSGSHPVEMHLPMPFLSYHPSSSAANRRSINSTSNGSTSGAATSSSSASGAAAAVAHQGAYDAMMTAVVFWSFIQEHPQMLSEMENAVSFFGINYWMNLGSNYDFLAWCQVIMVEHPREHFQSGSHIREFLDAVAPGVVDEVPGATVQFVRQGPFFNIVVRPHASASKIQTLCERLQRAGFKPPKQWAGKVSSVSMGAAALKASGEADSSGGGGNASSAAAGGSAGGGDAGGKLTKKQRKEQQRKESQPPQPTQRRRADSSCASSQMGDERENSGE